VAGRKLPSAARLRRVFRYNALVGTIWREERMIANGGRQQITVASGVRVEARRLAWCLQTGRWPRGQVVSSDGSLRWAALACPSMTVRKLGQRRRDSTRWGAGVHRLGPGRWAAHIKVGGRMRWLGTHASAQKARRARRRALALVLGRRP
jgi:hypothetical protein